MQRMMFRGHCIKGKEETKNTCLKKSMEQAKRLMDEGRLMTISVFGWKEHLFLYYECITETIFPHEFMVGPEDYLECWPGEEEERHWRPMMDIFHYNRPVSADHWRRKKPVENRVGRIAQLKPEMVSSYIFYHYQLQEERPAKGNKYGLIGIDGNLLFFYTEEPTIVENPLYEGRLNTANTPGNWFELMAPHFIFWEDANEGENIWRRLEVIFGLLTRHMG
jgi:hypothetical protein